MNFELRKENGKDYRIVEELTREAFWNIHYPGCDEHFVLHNLRKSKDFIPELDFVVVSDGKIIGNIVYSYAKIIKTSKEEIKTISFGPISVLPQFQKQGVGSSLINYSLLEAKKLGFESVLIYGDPRYYGRFGFRCAERFDIRNQYGTFSYALLALEIKKGALQECAGKFIESSAFEVNEKEFEIFEKTFPHKEKEITPSQAEFDFMVKMNY
jgi:predicted N-acetyltransferase YhbS